MSNFLIVIQNEYLLREWKKNPEKLRLEYWSIAYESEVGVPNLQDPRNFEPLSLREIANRKEILRQLAPSAFAKIFPEYGDCDYKDKTLVFKVAEKLSTHRD